MLKDKAQLIEEIRERFCHVDECPYDGPRVFFENAGGALTLKSVVERASVLAAIPDNQGRDNPASHKLVEIINQAKADMRLFFNAPTGPVFVGESGTELLFRLISAATLGAPSGGMVLGSSLEHPASVSACTRWAEIAGRDYVKLPHNKDTGTVTADDYAPFITKDTRVATIIHTSPVSGMGVDVKSIAKLIRSISPDCYIIVDGIQHGAHGGIDIASYDIDGYVVSPYKMFSRHGYGVAWLSERMSILPHDLLIGAAPDAWDLGTRDTASYATFSDVVDYFQWLGGQFTTSNDPREKINAAGVAIHDYEKHLSDAMLYGLNNQSGLAEMTGIEIIGGIDNPNREGLVAFHLKGTPSLDVVTRLREEGIRVHIRKNDHFSGNILTPLGLDDCIRVSMCHYNTEQEVAKFLDVMRELTQ